MPRIFDISQWQKSGTVQLVKDLGADGIVLRMGLTYHGQPEIDDMFIEFVNDAVAHGLPYGIYYYSKMQDSNMAQMEVQWINDRVYELLNGVEPTLGTWLDMEDDSTKFYGVHELVQNAIDTMKSWGFQKVGIYSGYSYIKDFLNIDDLITRQTPLWVANYDPVNWLRKEYPNLNHVGWQYTENYQGYNLDCSEWYGAI